MVVTVTNTQDGFGVAVAAHKDSEQNEKGEILFDNTYDPLPEPSPSPKPTTPPGDRLIQTGQLNWPISVLLLLGISLLAFGIVAVCKKEHHNR